MAVGKTGICPRCVYISHSPRSGHIVQDCWYLCLDLALSCDYLPNKTKSEEDLGIGLDFRGCQLGA